MEAWAGPDTIYITHKKFEMYWVKFTRNVIDATVILYRVNAVFRQ